MNFINLYSRSESTAKRNWLYHAIDWKDKRFGVTNQETIERKQGNFMGDIQKFEKNEVW